MLPPLHHAAETGDLDTAKRLLDAGAEVDDVDPWDNTALHLACWSETPRVEIVALLRRHGADPDRKNIHWETPRTKSWERRLLSGFDALSDLPAPPERETDAGHLTRQQLEAVAEVTRALVDHDRSVLERIGSFEDDSDPYERTRDYGRWNTVQLIMPPGDPASWSIQADDSPTGMIVAIEMWTREEGRSDLTLELEIVDNRGETRVTFENLHVM